MSPKLLPCRGRRRREGAFTLIEVCLALFVLVVGILPVVTLALSARQLDLQAQLQAVAYQAATRQMDTLLSQAMANRLTTTQGTFTVPASVTALYPAQGLSGSYSVTSVSSLGDGVHPVQQVAVQVSWTGAAARGVTSSARITTLIAKGAGT